MKFPTRVVSAVLLFQLCTLFNYAQIWLSDEDIFDEAEEFYDAEEYIEALPLYLQLEKKEIINPHISYKIGSCYLNIRGKKSSSIPYLEAACESVSVDFENTFTETNAPLRAYLLLGVAYRIENRLPEAISAFETLKQQLAETDPELQAIVDIHLQRCENARLLNAFPNEPRTERLPDQINTAFSNYNPVLVDSDSVIYYMEELKFYDALMRSKKSNGEWEAPKNITPAIGSDGDHILVGASADGNTLFLNYYEPLRAGELYSVHYNEETGWSDITPLNENINTVYHETHASLSSDGKTLYFTSNRLGGFGGLDIYKSEFDTVINDWGPAQNLGPKINTPFNEETPIINADNEILYFSSQGHLNMGGYDIYYSLRRGDNEWRQPINMGSPVSTTDDDIFYYPLDEHVSGLMSRLDNPATGYDIYQYNSMVFGNSPRFTVQGKTDNIDTTNYSDYKLAVVNTSTSDTVQYLPVSPDGSYEALLPAGNFDLFVVSGAGILLTSNIDIQEDTPEEILLASALLPSPNTDTAQEESVITPIINPQSPKDTLWLHHILYSFDTYQVAAEHKTILDKIIETMKEYPNLNFFVEGHTDAVGPAAYNLKLSRLRAKAIVNYMTASNGISTDRLSVQAKGEEDPIALNQNPDGTDCKTGRKYNRRVVLTPVNQLDQLIIRYVDEVPESLKYKGK